VVFHSLSHGDQVVAEKELAPAADADGRVDGEPPGLL